MQNSTPNSKNYSKGAQCNQERPTGKIVLIAGHFTGLPFLSWSAPLGKTNTGSRAIHTVDVLRVKSDILIG